MSPIPDETDNPSRNDPNKTDTDELEMPDHLFYPAEVSSSDDDEAAEGDNGGYVLLPQEPDNDDEESSDETHFSGLEAARDGSEIPVELMTEMHASGIDLSQSVAQGIVHPAFIAKFPDNKVPFYLQVPDPPKTNKGEVLWNQPRNDCEHQLMDSAQASKVKMAMSGFQLPPANIPDWAQNIPEDQWKQQLIARLTCLKDSKESSASVINNTSQNLIRNVDFELPCDQKECTSNDTDPENFTVAKIN